MLKYLIIQLDDVSTSYCHYSVNKEERNLMPMDVLKLGITFAMKENLMVQYLLPDYKLSDEYINVMESVENCKIASFSSPYASISDVLVIDKWKAEMSFVDNKTYILRIAKKDLLSKYTEIKDRLKDITRLNIVITDIEKFSDSDFENYRTVLYNIANEVEFLYVNGVCMQLNLLTDRIILGEMNNCNAGYENVTLAPDGNFYVCPAFYNDDDYNVGSVHSGIDIKNQHLYRIAYAPLCRNCDAYQCRRCIWLNKKTTLEVNTPSHEQCVVSHVERDVSRKLLMNMQKGGVVDFHDKEIKEISYIDPFDVRKEW